MFDLTVSLRSRHSAYVHILLIHASFIKPNGLGCVVGLIPSGEETFSQ